MGSMIGEFYYNIDNKGRLVIPPKFREFLGEIFLITKGLDGCLFVFSTEEWQRFEKKLSDLPMADKASRAFTRFFFAGAAECSLDKQGRIMLPASLRNYANLEKSVVVVGLNKRIEIWNEEKWKKNTAIDPEDIADRMAELGI